GTLERHQWLLGATCGSACCGGTDGTTLRSPEHGTAQGASIRLRSVLRSSIRSVCIHQSNRIRASREVALGVTTIDVLCFMPKSTMRLLFAGTCRTIFVAPPSFNAKVARAPVFAARMRYSNPGVDFTTTSPVVAATWVALPAASAAFLCVGMGHNSFTSGNRCRSR